MSSASESAMGSAYARRPSPISMSTGAVPVISMFSTSGVSMSGCSRPSRNSASNSARVDLYLVLRGPVALAAGEQGVVVVAHHLLDQLLAEGLALLLVQLTRRERRREPCGDLTAQAVDLAPELGVAQPRVAGLAVILPAGAGDRPDPG